LFFSKRNKELDQKLAGLNAKAYITVPHATGLLIPENTWAQLFYCEDKIVIEANNTTFNLPLDKITDITVKTDVEIQKYATSSVGGAIAGGIMFGVLGALIGGRTKTKTDKTIRSYLIITYQSDNETKYMAFSVTGTPKSHEFVKLFKERAKPATVVDL
jgi:hypothetical protein